jgi:hypothetical protein
MKLAVFFISVLSTTAVQAQSLKETTDWLRDFMEAEATVFHVDGNWRDHYQVVADGCQVTILHDATDLSCTKPKNAVACKGSPPVETRHSRKQFHLKDIDLRTITVDSNFWFRGSTVNLITLNERPLIANSHKFRADGDFVKQSWVDEENYHAYVVLPNPEAAKRVEKAFRHAIGLCGGKASPF